MQIGNYYKGEGKSIFRVTRMDKNHFYATGYNVFGAWREDKEFGYHDRYKPEDILEESDSRVIKLKEKEEAMK